MEFTNIKLKVLFCRSFFYAYFSLGLLLKIHVLQPLTLSLPLATIVDTVPVPLATKVDRTPSVPLATVIAVFTNVAWGWSLISLT